MNTSAPLSPEWQLLLWMSPRGLTDEAGARARDLVAQGVDWPRVLRLAYRHGVYPSLARNLDRMASVMIPGEVRQELKAACQRNALRSRLFQRELTRVAARLAQAGVPMMPLKGVALADRLYGDMAARTASDIDILIPREQLRQALAILQDDGYEPEDDTVLPKRPNRTWDVDRLLASNIEILLCRRDGLAPLLVELHWDIAWRWRADTIAIEDLWAEARLTRRWDAAMYELSVEWECLYLAVHAARHQWRALKWLVDIHDLCMSSPPAWPRLEEKAARFGWDHVLRLTLGACHELLGTVVPREFSGPVPDWVLSRLYDTSGAPVSDWAEALATRRLFTRHTDRIRYLARLLLLPTSREHCLVRLPASCALLYYLIRPARLLAVAVSRRLQTPVSTR